MEKHMTIEQTRAVVYRNEHSYCGPISMLKRLSSGDLVLVFREALWRGSVTHGDPTTRTSLIRSSDGGKTWHSQVTPDPGGGNGTTVNQMSDGRLIVSNFRWVFVPLEEKEKIQHLGVVREKPDLGLGTACAGVFTVASGTDGYTWECPNRLSVGGPKMVTTAGRIVETEDDRLLIPLNGRSADDDLTECWIAESVDGGETWRNLASVTQDVKDISFHEMRIIPLPADRLLAMMRTPESNFYQSRSADGGKTWSVPEETPIWCGGSSPGDLLQLADGRVLCTYARRKPPYGVRACISRDQGERWDIEDEIVIRDDGLDRDMGYPSSEQLPDGRILTVYYWHGEDQIRHLVGSLWHPPAP
jgi:hypothetical protein